MKALEQTRTPTPTRATTRAPHLFLQRQMSDARSLEKREALAIASVNEALDSPGQSLDASTRAEMESRFGHDFGNVRVHADATAADSARAVNALAYTRGDDIVFRAGAYAPHTRSGKRLLAHELTHVVQQGDAENRSTLRSTNAALTLSQPSDQAELEASRGAEAIIQGMSFASASTIRRGTTGALIQRADDEWDKAYGERKSKSGKSFEEYKQALGHLRATTAGGIHAVAGGGGTPAAPEIKFEVLMEIYPLMARDVKNDNKLPADKRKGREKQAREYLDSLNQAFHVMKIDTVEAQANYLAHAYVESDQFRQFTETAGVVREGAQKWRKDPTKLALDQTFLAKTYNKEDTPEAKSRKKTVNPGGKFEFIGRGPVQVTHNWAYTEVIAMLEKTAEDYKAEAASSSTPEAKNEAEKYATLAQKAADAVKANPERAADPEFTFLFSAAHMKRIGADVGVASAKPGATWTGDDPGSSWVAGGKQKPGSPQAEALETKSNAYARIFPALLREAKKQKPAAQTAGP